MLRTSLRSLWEHKRRLISTVLSVVLGVAFMAGTLVLAGTLNKVVDDLFGDAYAGIDAIVRGDELFESGSMGGTNRATVDTALVPELAQVDGVDQVEPYVVLAQGTQVLAADGTSVGATAGPPTILETFLPDLLSYTIREGGPPTADDEVVLNAAAARDGDLEVGGPVTILSAGGRADYTLVGVYTFGDADSVGGTTTAGFTLAESQRLAGLEGQANELLVTSDSDLSQQELVDRLSPLLPAGVQAVTATQAGEEMASDLQAGLSFINQILIIFAVIALLVGSFIIYNTFSILVAQRSRELALLRALGAGRGQVLGSVLIEALLVGLLSAVIGLAGGVLLAIAAQAGLAAAGVDLPSAGVVIEPSTILVAFVVGVGVTAVAALFPAIRATRVPPIAALRDVAVDRTGSSRVRAVVGVVVLALAVLCLAQAFTAADGADALGVVGLGSVLAFAAVVVLGPVIARPAARLIGSPLPRLRGTTGRLAQQNAVRNPKRTASTAYALMIGVALVVFINIFATSAQASISAEIDRGLQAELIVGPSNLASAGFSPALGAEVAEIDGVAVVSPFRFGELQVTLPDGKTSTTFVNGVDPTGIDQTLSVRMAAGSLADLTDGGIVIDQGVAEDEGLVVGDTVGVLGTSGVPLELTVQAISDDQAVLGVWTITTGAFDEAVRDPLDGAVFIALDDGADVDAVRAEIEAVAEAYPGVSVQDRDEWVGSLADQISILLNIIYLLLFVSVFIAFVGILNTLSLSIYERTRELGLLRAVGMTRRQVRSAVRWEAVIISLLGTALGVLLGIGLCFPLVKALEGVGFTRFEVPVGVIVVVVVLAAFFGVLASLLPARRAARLDVLDAIAAE